MRNHLTPAYALLRRHLADNIKSHLQFRLVVGNSPLYIFFSSEFCFEATVVRTSVHGSERMHNYRN